MFFRWPTGRRDRVAVTKMLIVGPIGILLIGWLVVTALSDLPGKLFQLQAWTGDLALERWGIEVTHLLLVMPVGAVIVLFSRLVIGFDTFGIFTPMLLALTFVQIGPVLGPLLIGSAILSGMLIMPLLERYNLSRMGMMTVLIGVVTLVLYFLQTWIGGTIMGSAFPVVVTALVIERWWIARETEGANEAHLLAGATIVLAVVIEFALVAPILKQIVREAPWAVPLASIGVGFVLARYRGLRFTEFIRFQPILEEQDGRIGN